MPLEAIDAHAIALAPLCFTDDVVFFNDELLQIFCVCIFFFPSFWYILNLG